MKREKRTTSQDQFTLGFMVAAAQVARGGHDTLAEELMRECGISKRSELLKVDGLETFDRLPLLRVLGQL